MSASATLAIDRHAAYDKSKIFLVSVLALFTAGVAASLRADIASDLQRIFFDPIDRAHSAEMTGAILGVAFLGFAFRQFRPKNKDPTHSSSASRLARSS